jgi:hypothetical protein
MAAFFQGYHRGGFGIIKEDTMYYMGRQRDLPGKGAGRNEVG